MDLNLKAGIVKNSNNEDISPITSSKTVYGDNGKNVFDQLNDLESNVLTKSNTTSFTPSGNYHPATKKYVDDNVGIKANKTDVLTKTNTTSFTPTKDYHPSTKKYVDDNSVGKKYNNSTGIIMNDIDTNIASCQYSLATGSRTKSLNDYSNSGGVSSISSGFSCFSFGTGCISDNKNKVLFISKMVVTKFDMSNLENSEMDIYIDTSYTYQTSEEVSNLLGRISVGNKIYGISIEESDSSPFPLEFTIKSINTSSNTITVTGMIMGMEGEEVFTDVNYIVCDGNIDYNYHSSISFGLNSLSYGECSFSSGYNCKAIGDYSHASGNNTTATGLYSHANGKNTEASGDYSHSCGFATTSSGMYSYSEGRSTQAIGESSHAEGYKTRVAGDYSHAEGYCTACNGNYSHAEGNYSEANGNNSHAEGNSTSSTGTNSHAEGLSTQATKNSSHAEGYKSISNADYSHAEGNTTTASGSSSHSEGSNTTASGSSSHSEGSGTIAEGLSSHAEGSNTIANGDNSHAEGALTTASGSYSHSEGLYSTASASYSHASGYSTNSDKSYMTAIGKYNKTGVDSYFSIGKGTSSSSRANAFRVSSTGAVYGTGAYNSSGADGAEMVEWNDGNVDKEDRVGLFVEWIGNKIQIANSYSRRLAGVISSNPSFIGNSYDDQWQGMYLKDEFERIIYEEVTIPAEYHEINGETVEISPERKEIQPKLNPEYNQDEQYIPRSERPEYGCVGMWGQILLKSDGTCNVGDFCIPTTGGIATKSEDESKGFLVLEVRENNIIKIHLSNF